ncbi:MAG: hypothetical protein QM770_24525 [Tepidisphaeraceae bacterium]
MLVLMYLVLARVIAETGMLYVLLPTEFNRPGLMLTNDLPASLSVRVPAGDYFHSLWIFNMLAHDTRQAMPGYATSATKLAEEAVGDCELPIADCELKRERTDGSCAVSATSQFAIRNSQFCDALRPFAFLTSLLVAIVLGFFLSGVATLYVRYNYANTLDRTQTRLDNDGWGAFTMPRTFLLDRAVEYAPPLTGPNETHSRPKHVAIGAGVTTALYGLRLRFAAWPLDPIGFLLCYTWGIRTTWFSIFIGWLVKACVVRFTGAPGLARLRNVALGLIVGETFAAAFWVIVSFIIATTGHEHLPIRMLPV